MSLINAVDKSAKQHAALFKFATDFVKRGGDPELTFNLSGRLYKSSSGWILLTVPNALVRGVFEAMTEPGIELPPSGDDNTLNAHISVMRPEELEAIGGPDKVTERGKQFTYTLGRIYSVEPKTWAEMQKVWYIKVHSPALQQLRRSYGLTSLPNEGKFDFHITTAVLRKNVLGRNARAKSS